MKSKHFPRYWPFVRGIHRSALNSPHKGQWRGALMFSLICVWITCWTNNRGAGDLRRHRAHYDVTLMPFYESKTEIAVGDILSHSGIIWSRFVILVNYSNFSMHTSYQWLWIQCLTSITSREYYRFEKRLWKEKWNLVIYVSPMHLSKSVHDQWR